MTRLLPRLRTIWDRTLWHGQHRPNAIRTPDVEKYALRDPTSHFARLQVNDKQRLFALDFFGVCPFLFHADADSAGVVAKIDTQLDEFVRPRNVSHSLDCPDPDI